MSYNWGDQRRNSLISTKMMEKAELARKQRLNKIKPTISNHLHPAVEKKLPKKDDSLNGGGSADSFYNSLLKFHSNQEQQDGSPFSVHNVNAKDSFFHPESEIEAFTGKLNDISVHEEHLLDERHTSSRQNKIRRSKGDEKLPTLKSSVGIRDISIASTRSDPDLSTYSDPRRRTLDQDAIDLLKPRSESAPSAMSSSKSDKEISHEEHGVVPKLNLNVLSKAESKATKTTKSKKDGQRMKTGTSLADLRDEHKAALELLKELGGAYAEEEDKISSSRFGAKLRTTVQQGRGNSNNEHVVDGTLKAGMKSMENDPPEVPEDISPTKLSSARSRHSESYGSEDFETD